MVNGVRIQEIKFKVFNVIKIVSTVLITGAIGLEVWNQYAGLTNLAGFSWLHPVFWIERFALIAHAIEGTIAAIYAPVKGKMPVQYGMYTFFVGTVGLVELFNAEVNKEVV